jgi:hypothetical protein
MRHHNDELILHYFQSSEFGPTPSRQEDWWQHMDPCVLVRLDVLRSLWGASITISGHARALGRKNGSANNSDHNVDRRGKVQCIDGFPAGLRTQEDAERFLDLAQQVGFSSIGLYPDWSSPGVHVGMREGHGGNALMATWGAITLNGTQTYVSWEEALQKLPEA